MPIGPTGSGRITGPARSDEEPQRSSLPPYSQLPTEPSAPLRPQEVSQTMGQNRGSGSATTALSHIGFPPWLQNLIGVGAIIVAITFFASDMKSDQRSTREEVARLATDLTAIRASLPNREVYEMRLDDHEKRLAALEQSTNVRNMMDQKLREDLIKGGVLK